MIDEQVVADLRDKAEDVSLADVGLFTMYLCLDVLDALVEVQRTLATIEHAITS